MEGGTDVAKSSKSLAHANNKLAGLLHKKLAEEDVNVFFSPFSISTAMSMLLRGTKEDTLSEMMKVLGYDEHNMKDEQVHASFSHLLYTLKENQELYTLAIANAVVSHIDFKLLPEYRSDLQELYNALALEVDFVGDSSNALKQINGWVKENTRDMIEEVLNSVDPSTVMVLLNAIYFKGSWLEQFDPQCTHNKTFYNKGLKEEGKEVPMMFKSEKFLFVEKDKFKALELPYKGNDIAMLLLLPHDIAGLSEFEASLDNNFIEHLRPEMHKVEVEVTLPKLHLEYSVGLCSVFQELGLTKIFDSNLANFKRLSDSDQLQVSEIIHKAVLDVNEEGSEAAAVTAIVMLGCCLVIKPEFNADHPFMFIIYDKRNDMILFMGRVCEM